MLSCIQNLVKDQEYRATALKSLKGIQGKCETIPSLEQEYANTHGEIRVTKTRL